MLKIVSLFALFFSFCSIASAMESHSESMSCKTIGQANDAGALIFDYSAYWDNNGDTPNATLKLTPANAAGINFTYNAEGLPIGSAIDLNLFADEGGPRSISVFFSDDSAQVNLQPNAGSLKRVSYKGSLGNDDAVFTVTGEMNLQVDEGENPSYSGKVRCRIEVISSGSEG